MPSVYDFATICSYLENCPNKTYVVSSYQVQNQAYSIDEQNIVVRPIQDPSDSSIPLLKISVTKPPEQLMMEYKHLGNLKWDNIRPSDMSRLPQVELLWHTFLTFAEQIQQIHPTLVLPFRGRSPEDIFKSVRKQLSDAKATEVIIQSSDGQRQFLLDCQALLGNDPIEEETIILTNISTASSTDDTHTEKVKITPQANHLECQYYIGVTPNTRPLEWETACTQSPQMLPFLQAFASYVKTTCPDALSSQ